MPSHLLESDFKFEKRIKVLNEQIKSESYSLNSDSREAFWEFVRKSQNLRYDRLFLLESGSLNATWKNEQKIILDLNLLTEKSGICDFQMARIIRIFLTAKRLRHIGWRWQADCCV